MKKISFFISAYLCLLITATGFTACDDNDEPKNEQTIEVVDGLTKDMAKGSISMEEFENKVMGKIWYHWNEKGEEDAVYIDGTGKEYPCSYVNLCGGPKERAYYFDNEKYVRFYIPPHLWDGYLYHRQELQYRYDPETGLVYADNGFIKTPGSNKLGILFYIESVSDTELIIHNLYGYVHTGFDPDTKRPIYDPYSYKRTVLKAATPEEVQKNWWDKYVTGENPDA